MDTFQQVGGDPLVLVDPSPSLVITRNLFAGLGMQTYVPRELLEGTVPAALLDTYMFWQNSDQSLSGSVNHRPTLNRSRPQGFVSTVSEARGRLCSPKLPQRIRRPR